MRVLFLYHDAGHAEALRRIKTNLAARGVELIDRHCHTQQQCRDSLDIKADLLFAHQLLMDSAIRYEHGPILICERIDGAQLAQSRKWLGQRNVLGVAKSYRLRPPELNNQYKGRYSAWILRQAGVGPVSPIPGKRTALKPMCQAGLPQQIPPKALRRIFLCYGFEAASRLESYAAMPVDFNAPRKYDAHYMATLHYSGSEIENHRRIALREIKRYPGAAIWTPGHTASANHFRATLADSKAVVSPWGCGEASYRDYEAMLVGTIVIKPVTAHVECEPDIFRSGETYMPCRPDFGDLCEKIAWVAAHWAELREMRIRNREMILAARHRDYIADRMAKLFREVLDGV